MNKIRQLPCLCLEGYCSEITPNSKAKSMAISSLAVTAGTIIRIEKVCKSCSRSLENDLS